MKGSKILLAAMALVIVGATSAVAQQDTSKKAPPAKAVTKAPTKVAPAPTFSVADIKAAQAGLAKGKFYTGTPSGRVDAATRTAIRKYQTANKLAVTGQLSDSLIAALKAAQ
jgi:peptidoglycan hydrolase-like protein with peptidoglycan-binding domain